MSGPRLQADRKCVSASENDFGPVGASCDGSQQSGFFASVSRQASQHFDKPDIGARSSKAKIESQSSKRAI